MDLGETRFPLGFAGLRLGLTRGGDRVRTRWKWERGSRQQMDPLPNQKAFDQFP
jgi:hypothetical protein